MDRSSYRDAESFLYHLNGRCASLEARDLQKVISILRYFLRIGFEELTSHDVESYIRFHPIYPLMLSHPMPESTIPKFLDFLLSLPTPPTLIQGTRESLQHFAPLYKDALSKKYPARQYEIKSVMRQGVYVVTADNFVEIKATENKEMHLATLEDVELLEKWHTEFLIGLKKEYEIPALKGYLLKALEEKSLFMWKDNGQNVATVGVVKLGERGIRTNRGYTIAEGRKKGYGAKLLSTICKNAFAGNQKYALAIVKDDNFGAIKVHEKLGYQLKGHWDVVSISQNITDCKL